MTKPVSPISERPTGQAGSSRSSRHNSLRNDSNEYDTAHGDGHRQPQRTASPSVPKSFRKQIARIREQIIMNRLDLRERRVDMRQQHSLVRSLEVQILRHWQKDVGSIDQDAVRRLHGDLCAALDVLGPMEEDYDEKEDGLNTLEFDLEIKEKRFYRQNSQSGSDASLESLSTRRTSMSTLSEGSYRHPTGSQDFLSPEYQYYSRVGDAKIVRERMMELEAQRTQYIDIERNREALGIPLYQENIEFLRNYDEEYAEHLEKLDQIEKDIRGLAIQAGLSNPDDVTAVAAAQDVGEAPRIQALFRRESSLTEPEQSGRPGLSTEEPPRRRSEADIGCVPNDPRSTRERINQWILERLGDSKLEKARHMAILNNPKLNQDAWWNLVLEFWQMDRPARSSDSSRHVSGASTSGKPQFLSGSFQLALDEASNVVEDIRSMSSNVDPVLPVTTSTWPQGKLTNHAVESVEQLKYLDLAANPLTKTGQARQRWDSI